MRSRIVLFIALVALVIGAKGILDTVNRTATSEKVVETTPQKPEIYVTAWQLNADIKRGQPLSIDKVTKRQLLLDKALELGIKEDVTLDFDPSTLINVSLTQGQYVLPEYQTKKSEPGYIDMLISEGMTLYPLKVSSHNLVKDYIRPGSYIDILTVSSPNTNLAFNADKPRQFRGIKASLFLKNIKVVNLGHEWQEGDIQPTDINKNDGEITVVIEVLPEHLTKLALAQRTMHIEIYRSQTYQQPTYAEVRNIMDNYMGIEELRGGVNSEGESL